MFHFNYYRTLLKMQKNSLGIFRSPTGSDLNSLGEPYLYSSFTLTPIPSSYLFFALTSKYLLYFQNDKKTNPLGLCELSFDLKFEVLRRTPWENQLTPGKPIGIRFEKQVLPNQFQTLEIYYHQEKLVDAWREQLERFLNQRNFHDLFKARRKIGKGAFATVYLAERLLDKKMVAVKAFSKERQYASEKGKESLINEINLMRAVNHENVIKIQGVYETKNSIYVILQRLQGKELHERLKNNQINDKKEIKNIIRSILQGLKALSSQRIIHRDLKPENIMFRKENSSEVVLCDFGLATSADSEKYLFVRCGTPGFVSPQIINIRDMSTRSEPISDVFSAGLIFHFLLFKKSIFEGRRYNEILAQNRACQFNFGKEAYQNCDPLAIDLLKKMLQIDPNTRFSAEKALSHPYFNEWDCEEKPTKTEMLDEREECLTNETNHMLRRNKHLVHPVKEKRQVLWRNHEKEMGEMEKENLERNMLRQNISMFEENRHTLRRSKRKSTFENQNKYKICRY